jgi:hypothetical protein
LADKRVISLQDARADFRFTHDGHGGERFSSAVDIGCFEHAAAYDGLIHGDELVKRYRAVARGFRSGALGRIDGILP